MENLNYERSKASSFLRKSRTDITRLYYQMDSDVFSMEGLGSFSREFLLDVANEMINGRMNKGLLDSTNELCELGLLIAKDEYDVLDQAINLASSLQHIEGLDDVNNNSFMSQIKGKMFENLNSYSRLNSQFKAILEGKVDKNVLDMDIVLDTENKLKMMAVIYTNIVDKLVQASEMKNIDRSRLKALKASETGDIASYLKGVMVLYSRVAVTYRNYYKNAVQAVDMLTGRKEVRKEIVKTFENTEMSQVLALVSKMIEEQGDDGINFIMDVVKYGVSKISEKKFAESSTADIYEKIIRFCVSPLDKNHLCGEYELSFGKYLESMGAVSCNNNTRTFIKALGRWEHILDRYESLAAEVKYNKEVISRLRGEQVNIYTHAMRDFTEVYSEIFHICNSIIHCEQLITKDGHTSHFETVKVYFEAIFDRLIKAVAKIGFVAEVNKEYIGYIFLGLQNDSLTSATFSGLITPELFANIMYGGHSFMKYPIYYREFTHSEMIDNWEKVLYFGAHPDIRRAAVEELEGLYAEAYSAMKNGSIEKYGSMYKSFVGCYYVLKDYDKYQNRIDNDILSFSVIKMLGYFSSLKKNYDEVIKAEPDMRSRTVEVDRYITETVSFLEKKLKEMD